MKKTLLKVLVGSRAHNLHDENSDYDYRAIYVQPTTKILSLGFKYKGTDWCEGETDNTAYEIGHFLHLATKCNPSVFEVLMSEHVKETTPLGEELKKLFPAIWNPNDAFNAFTGYSFNQRKKMIENKDSRREKFAVAYIRTLINLISLLRDGTFCLTVPDMYRDNLLDIRAGKWSSGKVLDWANCMQESAKLALEKCTHQPDLNRVNEFLLKVRKECWDGSNF